MECQHKARLATSKQHIAPKAADVEKDVLNRKDPQAF